MVTGHQHNQRQGPADAEIVFIGEQLIRFDSANGLRVDRLDNRAWEPDVLPMQMNAQADGQVAAPDVMALSTDEKPGNSRKAGDQHRPSESNQA